jgi:hypothetical protein
MHITMIQINTYSSIQSIIYIHELAGGSGRRRLATSDLQIGVPPLGSDPSRINRSAFLQTPSSYIFHYLLMGFTRMPKYFFPELPL